MWYNFYIQDLNKNKFNSSINWLPKIFTGSILFHKFHLILLNPQTLTYQWCFLVLMPNLTPHSRQISPSDQGGSEDNISGKTRVKTLQLMPLEDTQSRLQYSKTFRPDLSNLNYWQNTQIILFVISLFFFSFNVIFCSILQHLL